MPKEEYEYVYKIKTDLFYMIENIFSLGCFTLLAALSNHWWIIFFSILFQYAKTESKDDTKDKNIKRESSKK